jgi:nitrite reductase (NO-forming)
MRFRIPVGIQSKEHALTRNAPMAVRLVQVMFGVIFGIDATLKFQPAFISGFKNMIVSAAEGQPAVLKGWFVFWTNILVINPTFSAYMAGTVELALAFALIFGFMRRTAYIDGFIFSLLIWTVPEGLGQIYVPGSTDVGAAIIYAMVFLLFMIIDAVTGRNKYTIDYYIEKRLGFWK